ncbi:fungal Zn binuclear cluster domain-containing [Fusarium albosuccineum]|uniref:Fungal Zn binuclear cluster domain-containing n=1 Tax=Fusarium albosuccineum TaxID=1237068 RepID=A0A8H4KZ16_9HYPO|nr:fungal Zn binuclear cluster domain-containing [Fusarium albosuccineum]
MHGRYIPGKGLQLMIYLEDPPSTDRQLLEARHQDSGSDIRVSTDNETNPHTPSSGAGKPASASEQEAGSSTDRVDLFAYFSNLFTNKPNPHLSDIELMHHFTAVSYRTLTPDQISQDLLQHGIPRLALSNAFLLHQILALSGYHLAYLVKENRRAYLIQATQHQNMAICGLRAVLSRPLTSDNTHAIFATSILLTASTLSALPTDNRYNTSLDAVGSIIDIFILIKGINTICVIFLQEVKTGPLARLLDKKTCPELPTADPRLNALRTQLEMLQSLLAGPDIACNLRSAIGGAIAATERCSTGVLSKHSHEYSVALRAAFLWPILIPVEYVDLVRQREPLALAVLVSYCTILRMAESDSWVMNHWADSLIGCLRNHLHGGPYEQLII